MQFRTTTLLMIMATAAGPLAATAAAGPTWQMLSLLTTGLTWSGVVLIHWTARWDRRQPILLHITALTAAIFSTLAGMLGVSYCVGRGLVTYFAS